MPFATYFAILAYFLGLEFRKNAARLAPDELSNYLCYTVLLGGFQAMTPMVFFAFETASCLIVSRDKILETENCNNTTYASLFLSGYLFIVTMVSIASKAISRERRAGGLTYEDLALLRLEQRQEIQGALILVTALASMHLLSVLGVKGKTNSVVTAVGLAGLVAIGIAATIEATVLVAGGQPAGKSGTLRRSLGGASNFTSGRKLSVIKVLGEMKIVGMV